jgi:hypothetical protein
MVGKTDLKMFFFCPLKMFSFGASFVKTLKLLFLKLLILKLMHFVKESWICSRRKIQRLWDQYGLCQILGELYCLFQ